MFFVYYDIVYLLLGIIVIPGIIFSVVVQARFKIATDKYEKVFASQNITGHEMAEAVLKAYGIDNVKVKELKDSQPYSDYYDSKNKILALSSTVYNSSSITALGVAAHELGHAIQDKENYAPLKMRTVFGVLSKIGSALLIPMIILGIVFTFIPTNIPALSNIFFIFGFGLFGCSMLFALITLPVEINASKRTQTILVSTGLLNEEEFEGVKTVLQCAAMTYVAALVSSILNFARILIYFLIKTKNARD